MGVPVVHVNGAGFDQVANTFVWTMLAGKRPAGSICDGAGISVGPSSEISDLPNVLGAESGLETSLDELLAVGAERFIIELDIHLIVVGLFHSADLEGRRHS